MNVLKYEKILLILNNLSIKYDLYYFTRFMSPFMSFIEYFSYFKNKIKCFLLSYDQQSV